MGATTFYLLEQEKKRRAEQERKKKKEKSLEDMTYRELVEMAKKKEISGYSTMKKAELIEALKG